MDTMPIAWLLKLFNIAHNGSVKHDTTHKIIQKGFILKCIIGFLVFKDRYISL